MQYNTVIFFNFIFKKRHITCLPALFDHYRESSELGLGIDIKASCDQSVNSIYVFIGTGVTAYSLHPGAVKTEIWRYADFLKKPPVKLLFQFITFLFFKDCKQGAQTTIYCSVAEELAGVSGLYYADCKVKEGNPLAKDPGLRKKLWEASERITGESWKE